MHGHGKKHNYWICDLTVKKFKPGTIKIREDSKILCQWQVYSTEAS